MKIPGSVLQHHLKRDLFKYQQTHLGRNPLTEGLLKLGGFSAQLWMARQNKLNLNGKRGALCGRQKFKEIRERNDLWRFDSELELGLN